MEMETKDICEEERTKLCEKIMPKKKRCKNGLKYPKGICRPEHSLCLDDKDYPDLI